jgi:hypothetical protein
VVASLTVVMAVVGTVLPRSGAVPTGLRAAHASGQVRIYENGVFEGSGTLVDRNWVLTVARIFERVDSTACSLRFGGVDYRGTALARCAAAPDNGCSFGGTSYPAGAEARLSLGPASAPDAPGERKVLAWCTTETAFPAADSPSRPVLRVCFTDDDSDDIPLGHGWGDLTPDQVTDPTTKASVELSHLNAC